MTVWHAIRKRIICPPRVTIHGVDRGRIVSFRCGSWRACRYGGNNLNMVNPWDQDESYDYSDLWLGTKTVSRRINHKISGNESVNWVEYALAAYIVRDDPHKRCLVLGASEGHVERTLRKGEYSGYILSTDIADRALKRARERSCALGYSNIEYRVADLNTDRFDGPFDYIIAEGVLHHIERTEECLTHLRDILAPGGLLIAVEFEGPFRFQLTEPQVRWINAALSIVPLEFRPLSGNVSGVPADIEYMQRVHYVVASEESVRNIDPSEAAAGPRLKLLMPAIFNIVERKGFGGTLLSYMSGHFPFDQANADARVDRWLRVLLDIEDAVIETGLLEDEFVFYVAKS